jgi:hypothetical protein
LFAQQSVLEVSAADDTDSVNIGKAGVDDDSIDDVLLLCNRVCR